MEKTKQLSKFSFLGRPGFQMTFENGMSISVVWHKSAYCDRRSFSVDSHEDTGPADCINAEVGAWDENGDWYRLGENDDVIGYQTPDQVADFITKIKNLKTTKSLYNGTM